MACNNYLDAHLLALQNSFNSYNASSCLNFFSSMTLPFSRLSCSVPSFSLHALPANGDPDLCGGGEMPRFGVPQYHTERVRWGPHHFSILVMAKMYRFHSLWLLRFLSANIRTMMARTVVRGSEHGGKTLSSIGNELDEGPSSHRLWV